MQLLIAHGDDATRKVITRLARLNDQGLDVIDCADGNEALDVLLGPDKPNFAVVDWDLPGLDGVELCRLACQFHEGAPPYIILLAGPGHDVAQGLDAGAGDCVDTTADAAELRARLDAGRRIAGRLGRRGSASVAPVAGHIELVAQRSPFDEQDAAGRDRRAFELQSVLLTD